MATATDQDLVKPANEGYTRDTLGVHEGYTRRIDQFTDRLGELGSIAGEAARIGPQTTADAIAAKLGSCAARRTQIGPSDDARADKERIGNEC